VAATAIAGLVVVRQVGMHWGRELRWEISVGRVTAAHRYDHTAYARALDVVVLVVVPLAATALGAWLVGQYLRGERRVAAYGGAILGALAIAETLKQTLAARPGVPGKLALGYPSGHTTVAIATALALVLVGPARRWTLPAAAGLATLVAEGVIIDGWHLPSDAAGGTCLAAAWVALAHALDPVATLGRFERRDLVAAGATAAVVTLVLATQPGVAGSLDATRGTLVATVGAGLLAFAAVAAAAHPRRLST
jgi:membrane-associated phospholipid phosphatase